MATHASDCAVHNAPAMEPGLCDCGAVPDRSLLLSKDEGRRCQALEMAIDACDHISDANDATFIVDTAKAFEAYLKGE